MLVVALLLSSPFLFLGLGWGLPTRATDGFLFGERTPWTGKEIVELAGGWGGEGGKTVVGADVQRDAAIDRSTPVLLNGTDAQRADIVRRYRLYTYQPDEMINLRAFSQMRPGKLDLDPRLYQYGGLWFYPGGAALKMASLVGYVTLEPDVTYYLDRPEEVGRMYVVLRWMTAGWALVGVAAVYGLVRQMGGHPVVAAVVGLAFASAPGVVVFSHEAKPHVPGMVLTLLAGWAAVGYVRKGGMWRLSATAGLAGAAFGMVVSMLPAALIPLTAIYMGRSKMQGVAGGAARSVVCAVLVFSGVYAVSNPYVVWHLATDRSLLGGQISNSTAMYRVSSPLGTVGGVFYMLVSLTPAVLLVLPTLYGIAVDVERLKKGEKGVYLPVGLLVMGPTVMAIVLMFAALAAGKPGEFARFGLVVGAMGVVCAGYLSTRFRMPMAIPLVVVGLHMVLSFPELARYLGDEGGATTRLVSAERMRGIGAEEVTVVAEPAPYNTPALDLWKTRMVLLPAGPGQKGTLGQPPDSDGVWRMSWAARENFFRAGGLDRLGDSGKALER